MQTPVKQRHVSDLKNLIQEQLVRDIVDELFDVCFVDGSNMVRIRGPLALHWRFCGVMDWQMKLGVKNTGHKHTRGTCESGETSTQKNPFNKDKKV